MLACNEEFVLFVDRISRFFFFFLLRVLEVVYIAMEYLTRVFERLKNLATPISIHFCMNFNCMHFFFSINYLYKNQIDICSILFDFFQSSRLFR